MRETGDEGPINSIFHRLVEIARQELQMDVAWVSEFVDGKQVLRAVSGNEAFPEFTEGFSSNYESGQTILALTDDANFEDYVGSILRVVTEESGLSIAYMTALHPEDESLEHRYVYPDGLSDLPVGLTTPLAGFAL